MASSSIFSAYNVCERTVSWSAWLGPNYEFPIDRFSVTAVYHRRSCRVYRRCRVPPRPSVADSFFSISALLWPIRAGPCLYPSRPLDVAWNPSSAYWSPGIFYHGTGYLLYLLASFPRGKAMAVAEPMDDGSNPGHRCRTHPITHGSNAAGCTEHFHSLRRSHPANRDHCLHGMDIYFCTASLWFKATN